MNTTRRAPGRRTLASLLVGALIAAASVVGLSTPAAAADRVLTATATATANVGVSVQVGGSGFGDVTALPGQAGPHVYIALIEQGIDLSTITLDNVPSVSPAVAADGTFSGVLEQSAANLNPTKSYEVISWPTRSFPSAANLFARTAVSIDWNALFPPAPATPTSTTLVSSAAEVVEGTPVTLTATVAPATAGRVDFQTAAGSLGTASVGDGGVATLADVVLPVGTSQITAMFAPIDLQAFLPSVGSTAVTVTAKPVVADPKVRVTPTENLDSTVENVLTVSGTGFVGAGAASGTYVLFGAESVWSGGSALPSAGWISQVWVRADQIKDGAFTTTLTVPKDTLVPGTAYQVATSASSRLSQTDRSLDTFTKVTVAAKPVVADPKVTVTPTENLDSTVENVLTVAGSGFSGASAANGVYVLFGAASVWSGGSALPADGWITQAWVTPSQITDGSFTTTLTVPAGALTAGTVYQVATSAAHSLSQTDRSLDTFTKVTVKASVKPTIAVNPTTVQQGGTVTVTGAGFPAGSKVKVTVGATALALGEQTVAANGTFSVPGIIPVGFAVADHTVTATAGTVSATTSLKVVAKPVVTDGPAVVVSPSENLDPNVENVLTVSGAGFTGAAAANGIYLLFGEESVWSGGSGLPADGWLEQQWIQPKDIVAGSFTASISVPAGTLVPGTDYQVVTSAAHGLSQTDRSLDTFTKVTVKDVAVTPIIRVNPTSVQQGAEVTVTGGGFPAGEQVTVTVHSDPLTLGTATVAANGTFSLTGTIPADFEAKAHTVTAVAGEITASTTLTVTAKPTAAAPETPAAPTCVARAANDGWFEWGVKASFRDYINGSIAKGSYSLGWGSGSGAYNTEDQRGRVSFGGAASFTGHSGVLALTISNPRVQITGPGSGLLIVDIQSAGYGDSPSVNAGGVVFANLSLPSASVDGNQRSWNGASATLTAAGADAFMGFYSAGTALDSVSFGFTLGGEVPCDSSTSTDLAVTGQDNPTDLLWLAMVLVGLGAAAALRRRSARA